MHTTPRVLVNTTEKYDSYIASIYQSSDEPPTVKQVFENTLNVDVTFTRDSDGIYYAEFNKSIFESEFDYVVIHNSAGKGVEISAQPVWFNVLDIRSLNLGEYEDNNIGRVMPCILEIRKYK